MIDVATNLGIETIESCFEDGATSSNEFAKDTTFLFDQIDDSGRKRVFEFGDSFCWDVKISGLNDCFSELLNLKINSLGVVCGGDLGQIV